MYLFKVTGWSRPNKSGSSKEKFITSLTRAVAISKFIGLASCQRHLCIVEAEVLCKRDDIIPTVEPSKEDPLEYDES